MVVATTAVGPFRVGWHFSEAVNAFAVFALFHCQCHTATLSVPRYLACAQSRTNQSVPSVDSRGPFVAAGQLVGGVQ